MIFNLRCGSDQKKLDPNTGLVRREPVERQISRLYMCFDKKRKKTILSDCDRVTRYRGPFAALWSTPHLFLRGRDKMVIFLRILANYYSIEGKNSFHKNSEPETDKIQETEVKRHYFFSEAWTGSGGFAPLIL